MAYVHKKRESEYHAFTPYTSVDELGNIANVASPTAKLTANSNKIVVSLGIRF